MQELNVIAEFQRAGLRDPLEKHRELDEYRRAEAEAYQTTEQKRKDDFYQENYNR